jgi:plastocyanin
MNGQTINDIWTGILDFLARIITPDWNEVISWLPLIFAALVVLVVLGLLPYQWWRHRKSNRSRLMPRVPPPPPPGVHLPGPSRWPFVVPVGAALILWGLAIQPTDARGNATSPVNWPVFLAGLAITLIAIAGWARDAMKEWQRTEGMAEEPMLLTSGGVAVAQLPGPLVTRRPAPAHLAEPVELGSAPDELQPPPGVHLPGPSPWPFFAPVGLAVLFFGLVFSPLIALAGLLMSIIAAAGWVRDAGDEYRQVEEGQAPEPRTRDPERAFPKRLVSVYVGIFIAALVLGAIPGIIGLANQGPGASPSGAPVAGGGGGGEPPGDQVAIVARNTAFDPVELTVPADKPFTIGFDNQDPQPHNVVIFSDDSHSKAVFTGDVVTGPTQVDYKVSPLAAGTYPFICAVHPNMKGSVTAR